jgi:lipoate---protein ligase
MLLIDNRNITDPQINLAIEEYALRNLPVTENYLLLYINRPSVIIGKHQNPLQEIDRKYAEEHAVPVLRRISGGGAVYHDLGNLNFSFISRYEKSRFNNYRESTRPVIRTLKSLSVTAELNNRNDIVVGERKISGNAQFTSRDRMFSHGTLLFNTDLNILNKVLQPTEGKYESRGRKSVPSRVANIREFFSSKMEIAEFEQRILRSIFGSADDVPTYHFNNAEWDEILSLSEHKYNSWDWNYGESPSFVVRSGRQFPRGHIELSISVERGMIAKVEIRADESLRILADSLKKKLPGVKHRPEDLSRCLNEINKIELGGNVFKEVLLDMLY